MHPDTGFSVRDRVYDTPPHEALVGWVSQSVRSVHREGLLLDLGCGTGSNLALLADAGFSAVGLTVNPAEAKTCADNGRRVVVADASLRLPFTDGCFEVIFASHVLEHLANPWASLKELRRVLAVDGVLYAAFPNVVFAGHRLDYLSGRFRYEDAGALDVTHLRFFDLASAREMIESSGFVIVEENHLGWVPLGPLRRIAPRLAKRLDQLGYTRMPGLFAFEFIFKAQPAG